MILFNNLNFFILKINYKNLRFQKNRKKMLNIYNYKKFYNAQFLTIFNNFNSFGLNLKYYLKIFFIYYGVSLFTHILFIKKNLFKLFQQKFRTLFINSYLKKLINKNLDFKKVLLLYQAQRQIRHLPSRGQRTQTNARTVKRLY